MKKCLIILSFLALIDVGISSPRGRGNLVVRIPKTKKNEKVQVPPVPVDTIIYEMNVHTNVSNRFAKTLITSKVRNPNAISQDVTFTVVLPEKAFISGFVLRIDEKEYKAYVKEKEEAKKIYEVAKSRGQTAGHVAVSSRDSNVFTIDVNVEPQKKAAFLLTYEELLERKNNQYELVMNIHPGQVVEKLDVKVLINESRPLSFVRSPSVRADNEIKEKEELPNELSKIDIDGKTAVVEFHPGKEEQLEFARKFGKRESEGLSGQFVVQYDVQREPNGGEVLLQDGYFVHFFAPDDLKPLPKHVVFVLDTSGSMGGRKMKQLKEAMSKILEQLQPGDQISLVEFNSGVYVWDIEGGSRKEILIDDYQDPFTSLSELQMPRPAFVDGNATAIKGKKVVEKLNAGGSTNTIGALETALFVTKTYIEEKNHANQSLQPIIMFLTDGEPMSNNNFNTKEKIPKIVTKLNANNNGIPMFTLSFGNGADKGFLRRLSLENHGFSRHIFEGADASIQLENFYKEISVPLLSDIKFEYADTVNVTRYRQSVFFRGSEIAICGVYDPNSENPLGDTKIRGTGDSGYLSLRPSIEKPVTSLERLWAYLSVKNKLEKRETAETDLDKYKITKEALQLALKYSFVTDVTSLVVVKPNDTYSSSPFQYRRRLVSRPALSTPAPLLGFAQAEIGVNNRVAQLGSPQVAFSALSPESEDIAMDKIFVSAQKLGSFGGGNIGAHLPGRKQAQLATVRPVATTFKPRRVSTPTPPTTTASSNLKTDLRLTWLKSVVLANETININGSNYQLEGESLDNLSQEECLKTPKVNGTGVCTLLKDCPEVFEYLTSFEVYAEHFCPVSNKYAGVCCPKKDSAKN